MKLPEEMKRFLKVSGYQRIAGFLELWVNESFMIDLTEWPILRIREKNEEHKYEVTMKFSRREGCDELRKENERLRGLLESQYKSNCFFDATLGEGSTSTAATKKADEMWDEFKKENGF
jgi:hypothetical protein